MTISSLADLRHNSITLGTFYQSDCFQTFVAGIEETLEERLTEISAIAISRAGATASPLVCDLALDALLHQTRQQNLIASASTKQA